MRVRLAKHPDFDVEEHNLIYEAPIAPWEAVLGASIAKLRHARFVYWVMDLNPDEAMAASSAKCWPRKALTLSGGRIWITLD